MICLIPDFIWLQITTRLFFILLVSGYLVHFKPFEEPLALRLELYNEATEAFLLYHIMCFSDWYQDQDTKDLPIAISFNVFLCLNLAVHMVFLVIRMIYMCRVKHRRGQCCC